MRLNNKKSSLSEARPRFLVNKGYLSSAGGRGIMILIISSREFTEYLGGGFLRQEFLVLSITRTPVPKKDWILFNRSSAEGRRCIAKAGWTRQPVLLEILLFLYIERINEDSASENPVT